MKYLKKSPKILKNNKYYFKIFSEIDFQKFNFIFKIKILESTVNGVYTGQAGFLIKSEKSQKMPEGRKYNFKKECESGIQNFDPNCKLKFPEPTSDTGRHRF